MATTLWELKTNMYALMNDSSSNTTYTSNNRDIKKINNVIKRVCSWYFKSALDANRFFKTGDLSFLRGRQYFEFKKKIPCTTAITVGAITIDIDTTNLSSAGYIYSQWMVIKYTGKTPTQLTWVSWVIANFDVWTYFIQIYPFDAAIDKTYQLFYLNEKNLEIDVLEVQREDDRYQREKIRSFVVVFDEATWQRFIMVRWFKDGDRFLLKYYKNVTDLVDNTDETVIPDDYTSVIEAIAAWELMMESEGESFERQNKLKLGEDKLQEMYAKFTIIEKDLKRMVKMAPYNFNSISWLGAWQGYTRTGFRIY